MARKIIHTGKGPVEIKPQKKSIFVCTCGLSKNQPSCDSSHKKTLDEKDDKIYEYDKKGNRITADCCGSGCCGSSDCCNEK